MPKKKRSNLTRRKGRAHSKKIKTNAMLKGQFEQESSNFRNQGTRPPCTSFNEDLNEKGLRFPAYQNVKPFILNKCDVTESDNSILSVVPNSIKIEETDEVSVENIVLYQPKYIVGSNFIYEKYTNEIFPFQEDPTELPMDQDFKPQISNDCDINQSNISNRSPVLSSVKIEENYEVFVENSVLYQPTEISGGNSIAKRFTNESGYMLSADDSIRSRFSINQNVQPFILNKCDEIESHNSFQSDLSNSVKIEQTEEVSVENTVLYQPKYIVDSNCIDEQFTNGSDSSPSQEDPNKLPIDQDFKPQIPNDCDIIQSKISIQSPVPSSVKIGENVEVSVRNSVLCQPSDIAGDNSIAQQYKNGSGYILRAEDSTRSCFFQPGNAVESSISFTGGKKERPRALKENRDVGKDVTKESGSHLTDPQIYQCQFCDHTATEMSKLHVHINSFHIKLNCFKCKYCYFKAFSESDLLLHVDAVCTSVCK